MSLPLFAAMLMISAVDANAGGCDVIKILEKAASVNVVVEGDAGGPDHVGLKFTSAGKNKTLVTIVKSVDRESDLYFKGEYNYYEKKIGGKNVCVLDRYVDGDPEPVNSYVIDAIGSHAALTYIGPMSDEDLADYVKAGIGLMMYIDHEND